jgi:hypothetical protein
MEAAGWQEMREEAWTDDKVQVVRMALPRCRLSLFSAATHTHCPPPLPARNRERKDTPHTLRTNLRVVVTKAAYPEVVNEPTAVLLVQRVRGVVAGHGSHSRGGSGLLGGCPPVFPLSSSSSSSSSSAQVGGLSKIAPTWGRRLSLWCFDVGTSRFRRVRSAAHGPGESCGRLAPRAEERPT